MRSKNHKAITAFESAHLARVKELPCSVCEQPGPSDERWLPVVEWEGLYEVSDMGRVRSLARKSSFSTRIYPRAQVAPILGSRGYMVVNLSGKGVRRQFFLHKLVLTAFNGARPFGMQACHNDGNRANCALVNLRWDTPKANHADKRLHGTQQTGARGTRAKFTEDAIKAIRQERLTPRQAMNRFGLSRTHAKRIVAGKCWEDVHA